MKKALLPALMALVVLLSSCDAIKGVFKAGMYAGIVAVIIIVAAIIYFFSKFSGGSNR
ncbi:phosphatidate cytidylyltransferase [Mucilaginibacter lacusdianchii]|uniref:phosphatidate cytidylyltransferase n=1 Tax=Mucilaginibacter lacusdianchii TaxID=2684211 RepID=UPI00131C6998|nr:phosphatidate cytidylyltransferase [Mucilaginibacter sp. JXJ CY 39]